MLTDALCHVRRVVGGSGSGSKGGLVAVAHREGAPYRLILPDGMGDAIRVAWSVGKSAAVFDRQWMLRLCEKRTE